ncbi:hypothetical protein [Okeania sp. SIO2B3]|nr:hypothetical protein [Okeania sp. SIO2B3]NET42290.1 hypothetical protein [Okeania sp. SIO2B3]
MKLTGIAEVKKEEGKTLRCLSFTALLPISEPAHHNKNSLGANGHSPLL